MFLARGGEQCLNSGKSRGHIEEYASFKGKYYCVQCD